MSIECDIGYLIGYASRFVRLRERIDELWRSDSAWVMVVMEAGVCRWRWVRTRRAVRSPLSELAV